jgi:cytochrome P450
MSDDLIRDQLMTMLIAGHDTSTAALAWALYLLGQHPEHQARARAEVDGVLGGDPPRPENWHAPVYVGQIIDETLRLYPPIHLGSRRAAVDLEFNGYHIPAGQRVLYSIYLTQRHPDYWPDPGCFDPTASRRASEARTVYVSAVWRRSAQLHGRGLRPGGDAGRAGAHSAAL